MPGPNFFSRLIRLHAHADVASEDPVPPVEQAPAWPQQEMQQCGLKF